MSVEPTWMKRKQGLTVRKTKRKGTTDYKLLETFDPTGEDPVREYWRGIESPEPVGNPNFLSHDFSEAEKRFEDQTK
jgi:hypothetical protein